MASIELYINKQLCEIENPETFSIYLKRQFLNPAELSTKDAQKSYDITLPATAVNNTIFGYTNTEEVRGKFSQLYDAQLLVDGVKIFDGKFRLSSITKKSYKGNLGVPAPKTVKDIFGETMMNQAGKWELNNFKGFDSISEYNNAEDSPVIFPLVLYGLLPKSPKENGEFTGKDIYDNSVTLGLEDFYPSVNCVEMLKNIFEQAGYNLSGTALADERLSKLYVSYKNPSDYEFDWGVSKIWIGGEWKHYRNNTKTFENKYVTDAESRRYIVNLFDSQNSQMAIHSDNGGNITTRNKTTITIPRSGLYKIRFNVDLSMLTDEQLLTHSQRIGVRTGTLDSSPIEIHLVKNLDKSLNEIQFINKFALDNINQDIKDDEAVFPEHHRVNFIDPKIDKNFLCGFAFGKHPDENFRNPLNVDYCNPMAISGGRSWDFDGGNGVTDRTYSAVYSPSYLKRNWDKKGKFIVDLQNADTHTWRNNNISAGGIVSQVVWLDKEDKIDLLTLANYKFSQYKEKETDIFFQWDNSLFGYSIDFSLEIEPFNHYRDWLKIDDDGSSTEAMDWDKNDEGAFVENQIDLMKSLPSEVKINDWIDNFCKAFNLTLYNVGGNRFNLDIKAKEIARNTSAVIDLDEKANINQLSNQPLNLPSVYELGFTIDTGEEGYVESIAKQNEQAELKLNTGDDGGGTFETGSEDVNKQTQTSNFSYCWYKKLYNSKLHKLLGLVFMEVPVIADHEAWENDYDYKEMLSKEYFDKGQRFWYKSGVKELNLRLGRTATVALVSDEYDGNYRQKLNYRNEPDTIMSNYFLLLTNQKHYTIVNCYLSPEEYKDLGRSLVKLNGDLYYAAEIDGYDPLGKKPGTIKLIRQI
ncbi:hypothetical protein M2451_001975 [Dysgonomonas sp. PFB1-18]|uniref:hypothetical protein n=1 Tax=unclassified Dysgonomonas TaxID=2630389 RepID=UPI002475E223|nr:MULTISPECIES: hypothetical protein [unclassified Dysgonomonas]MDH6309609.1 hypothetical protein [Dysgonomonas sp. PF1-14]MDH6339063.1 hypothetical protein [Dysgonomonas sp. PF1-16]MDH6380651.1 hypothetical protein [Dysgonomonas sp. PFB1-18]MDH6398147.1 hypothetical protein [Dysgonomonas sp. PF1-23]